MVWNHHSNHFFQRTTVTKTRMSESKPGQKEWITWLLAVAPGLSAAVFAQNNANTIEPATAGMKK